MRLIPREKLEELPPVDWLIKDYIPAGSLSMLWAKQESFKSFVAVSMACSVATGKDWIDRIPIGDSGPVIYIAAEGQRGIRARLAAWERRYNGGKQAKSVMIVPEPVMSEEVPRLIEYIERARVIPRLVIVDTYSRCLAGENENDAGTAEKVLRAYDQLRHKYDASVLIIHHCDKMANWPRGSYALQAAMDAIFQVQREDGSMVCNVLCRKQKDAERSPSLSLIARSCLDSLVLERA